VYPSYGERVMISAIQRSLVLAVLLAPTPMPAQRLPQPFLPFNATIATSSAGTRSDSLPIPPTYWLEGGVIGALGLGIIAAIGFHQLCESQNCTSVVVGGAALGAAVGFPVGALIGGQFHKRANAANGPP
jgi:hypothetical protein